jgi:PAS domain S-box-containing protein
LAGAVARVVVPYAVFAGSWILLSDRLLEAWASDAAAFARWSTYKGGAFVLVTALLLASLLVVEFRARERDLGALRGSQERLRHALDFSDAVLDSLPGVLYLYDRNGRFLRWNDNFERATGYAGDEIAQMHPLDFIAETDRDRVAVRIEEVFARGESSVEGRLLSRDGREVPYYFTGVATRIGGRECLVGVGIDISERRRAEEERRVSEARYRTLFEHAPDGILIADGESRYLDANASICRMLGYSRQELIGKHASDIVTPAEVQHIEPALDTIKARAGYHREWRFRRKDGSTFPAEVIATVMPDGNLMGMVRDVTDRRAVEDALRELNETLELKVATRTQQLQAALQRAEAADRLKSAFLATMSHELRTPLNSIIGFTGVVLQGLAGPLSPEQAKQLGMVRGSARHLLELINDVLDLSKIEAGQLEVRAEPFDLPAAIGRVVESVRPLADRKGLALDVEIAAGCGAINSDRRRVEQILLNLLANAIKFTDRGRVGLAAEPVDALPAAAGGPAQPGIRIRVSDTGIGIRPEDLATLFRPFRQIDTGLSRRHEGTGLGLAICRRLAGLLGGEIVAASEWSRGSEFTFTLPLERAPMA